jgi:hypothetical protein
MTPSSLTDPLDQERAASMADEGGTAGAQAENQEMGSIHSFPPPGSRPRKRKSGGSPPPPGSFDPPRTRIGAWAWVAGTVLLVAFAALEWGRKSRRNSLAPLK